MRERKQNKYERVKDYNYWEKYPSKKALKKFKTPAYQFKGISKKRHNNID